eukprot:4378469-Amphidinium_carterae.1
MEVQVNYTKSGILLHGSCPRIVSHSIAVVLRRLRLFYKMSCSANTSVSLQWHTGSFRDTDVANYTYGVKMSLHSGCPD